MPRGNRPPDREKMARIVAEARRAREQREGTYREQALKLYPHLCGRCGREFTGKSLKELTVHHKDGDHMNNPPDGSNWELLCLYCHDMAHGTAEQLGIKGSPMVVVDRPALGFQAFEGLKDLLPSEDDNQ